VALLRDQLCCHRSRGTAIQFFVAWMSPFGSPISRLKPAPRDCERTGQALFVFEEPEALAPRRLGDITAMFLLDEEGELVTRDGQCTVRETAKAQRHRSTFTWKNRRTIFARFQNCRSPNRLSTRPARPQATRARAKGNAPGRNTSHQEGDPRRREQEGARIRATWLGTGRHEYLPHLALCSGKLKARIDG